MSMMNSSDPFAGLIPPPAEVDDTHKVYSIAAACIVLCLVSCAMVITRLVLKIWKADWGADDYAIIPAAVELPAPAPVPAIAFASSNSSTGAICWLVSTGCLHQSQCWGWEATVGDYNRRVLPVVQGM